MEKNKVAVIGAGLMGNGIAQACATAGYDVVNIDTFEAAIEKSKATVEKLFSRKVAKGSMTEEKKAEILGRLTYSQNFEDVKGAFLVVEAVPEKIEIKKDTFKKVDELADAETIIVSNTSGLSISEIASVTNRPDKVMGAHFFYPAPVMKLLELVRGLVTSDETYDVVKVGIPAFNPEADAMTVTLYIRPVFPAPYCRRDRKRPRPKNLEGYALVPSPQRIPCRLCV